MSDCNCIDCSMPGFPVLHYLLEFESVMLSNHLILCHPFSSCSQSFPTSGSFPVRWLLASGSQSTGALASASVLPVNFQGWFPLGMIGFNILAVQGTLKRLLQLHSLNASVLQCSAFFMVQLTYLYLTTGKTIALTYMNLCWPSDVCAF